MAAAKKSKPLSIDELLDAQRAMLTKSNNLSEKQIQYAKEQIDKLEAIKKLMVVETMESYQNDKDIQYITKPKGDSKHVSLGDIKEQLKTLDKDIKENLVNSDGEPVRPDRSPLPKFNVIKGGKTNQGEQGSENAPEEERDLDQERTDRLRKIGGVIEKKTAIQKGGSRNETLNTRNAAVYDRFVGETKDRQKFLADATDEQAKIFSQLENVMIKLREAGSEDSEKLREEIAKLSGHIEQSPDNNAKKNLKPVLENIQRTASTGERGNEGSLGDAFAALTGKKTVLKEGFSYDSRLKGSQIRDSKGQTASAETASMGRLKGAGSILGNWILEKNEKNIEGMRHEGFQKFLDNFRPSTTDTGRKSGAPETGTRLENIANLQGQQDALMGKDNEPSVSRKPKFDVIEGGKGSAHAEPKHGPVMPSKVDKMNVTANVVNIKAGKINGGGGGGGGGKGGGRGNNPGNAGPKGTPPTPPTGGKSIEEPTSKPGGGLGDFLSGRSGRSTPTATPPPAGVPAAAEAGGPSVGDIAGVAAGGGVMARTGSMLRAAAPVAAAGAVMYGAGRALDYGLGAMGVGKDAQGNDIQIDQKADDANWNRMSWFEKAQSGMARGIEKVGGFVAPNMANQAAADRVKKESEYFAQKDATAQAVSPAGGKEIPAIAPTSAKPKAELVHNPNPYDSVGASLPDAATPKDTPSGMIDVRQGLTEEQWKEATSMKGGKYRTTITGADGKELTTDQERIDAIKQGRDAMNAQLANSFKNNPTPILARAAGGPVVEGKSYLVGERGPEIMTPQKSGKITPNNQLKDLEGQDLKDFQKYSQARAQIENIENMGGGGKNTFEDVDPELKAKRDRMARDNYEYGEKLKARGIDVEAHYNRPEGPAEPKMGEAGYKSLEERYGSGKKIEAVSARDHAGTLNDLSSENAMAKDRRGQPIVVNNNTTNNSSSKGGEMPMAKGSARNEESSLARYGNRTASFY